MFVFQRSFFRPFKLNPRYPAHSLVLRCSINKRTICPYVENEKYNYLSFRELLRSLRGVAICTALEVDFIKDMSKLIFSLFCQVVVNKLHVEGVFPTSLTPEVTKIGPDGAASLLGSFSFSSSV